MAALNIKRRGIEDGIGLILEAIGSFGAGSGTLLLAASAAAPGCRVP
jgi:hypothetical protein